MAEKDHLDSSLSSVNPSVMASYLATLKMLAILLKPWKLIYLGLFVQILSMFCFAFSHLKRSLVIIYGNGLTTSPFPK